MAFVLCTYISCASFHCTIQRSVAAVYAAGSTRQHTQTHTHAQEYIYCGGLCCVCLQMKIVLILVLSSVWLGEYVTWQKPAASQYLAANGLHVHACVRVGGRSNEPCVSALRCRVRRRVRDMDSQDAFRCHNSVARYAVHQCPAVAVHMAACDAACIRSSTLHAYAARCHTG